MLLPITPSGKTPSIISDRISEFNSRWEDCDLCSFSRYRNNVVHYKGNPESGIVLVGEAPGKEEDKKGIPFVGDAGKVLDKGLKLAHMTLNDCCVINLMGCRPCSTYDGPNLTPNKEDIPKCIPRLEGLLNILKPSVLVLMGRTAQDAVLGYRANFPRLRFREVLLCFCLHPAAIIYNAERKEEWRNFWKHFRMLRKFRGKRKTNVVWKLPLERKGAK